MHPERRDPETEARRLATLRRADALAQKLGPLTTERWKAGIPLPLTLVQPPQE